MMYAQYSILASVILYLAPLAFGRRCFSVAMFLWPPALFLLVSGLIAAVDLVFLQTPTSGR